MRSTPGNNLFSQYYCLANANGRSTRAAVGISRRTILKLAGLTPFAELSGLSIAQAQDRQFRPGRFAPGQTRPVQPNAYVPFGGGPRLCIGMQFALTEMQLVTLELLRQFDIEWVDGQPPVTMQPLITLRPRGDFLVRLVRRS